MQTFSNAYTDTFKILFYETNYNTVYSFGPRREKTCLRRMANNTGSDQPAHPRSLISAFVIRFSESIIYRLAAGEISIF